MLNKITILLRVGIPVIADQFMVGSPTGGIRGIPSIRGIKLNLRLLRRRPGQTSNLAIIPSTASGEIQANKNPDSDLTEAPLLKPSRKPSPCRNNTKPKHPNPTVNRTYHSVLRPLPHAG
jgi:hypothetical protein